MSSNAVNDLTHLCWIFWLRKTYLKKYNVTLGKYTSNTLLCMDLDDDLSLISIKITTKITINMLSLLVSGRKQHILVNIEG